MPGAEETSYLAAVVDGGVGNRRGAGDGREGGLVTPDVVDEAVGVAHGVVLEADGDVAVVHPEQLGDGGGVRRNPDGSPTLTWVKVRPLSSEYQP